VAIGEKEEEIMTDYSYVPPADPLKIVPPWVDPEWMYENHAKLINRAWGTCKRGRPGSCINSNMIRAFARALGRAIRAPQTYRGEFHWSECVNGVWHQFKVPLLRNYALKIDGFDASGNHFELPKKPPFGKTVHLGECKPSTPADPQVIKDRRERWLTKLTTDGDTGLPIERRTAKLRELQAQYCGTR
jgi:hypothetical protein